MEKYEIMYILKANLDEETRKAAMDEIHAYITDNGGKVENVNEWGLRDFAYVLKEETKGYYVVLDVTAENIALSEFKRKARHNSNMLRSLITKKQK